MYLHRRLGGRTGKMRLAHHVIWENSNGPIPEGHVVHHIDHNKMNNNIGNLKLLSYEDHQRVHSPNYCLLVGVWHIVCQYCREVKSLDNYSPRAGTSRATICKPCRAEMARIERACKHEQK